MSGGGGAQRAATRGAAGRAGLPSSPCTCKSRGRWFAAERAGRAETALVCGDTRSRMIPYASANAHTRARDCEVVHVRVWVWRSCAHAVVCFRTDVCACVNARVRPSERRLYPCTLNRYQDNPATPPPMYPSTSSKSSCSAPSPSSTPSPSLSPSLSAPVSLG
eukprot:6198029-Pleurochrysis_carterae.AAC.1